MLKQFRIVSHTGSTNTDLLARCDAGTAVPGDVLLTFDQRAGRGRNQNTWVCAGGLALSIVLATDGVALPRVAGLVHPIGLAVRSVLREVGAAGTGLAWPNDVVVSAQSPISGWGNWRKICGILAERQRSGLVVVGIGVNLDFGSDDPPVPWATDLRQAAARWDGDRMAFARRLAAAVWSNAESWRTAGGDLTGWLPELTAANVWCGQQVTARCGDQVQIGTFLGLANDGAARIETDSGIQRWIAGEVRHMRTSCDERYS